MVRDSLSIDLTALDALTLSNRLAAGQTTSVEIVTAFLDRIDRLNPSLNAIVSLRARDDILEDARKADATERSSWLHGLPIAIKDLSETADLRTTFGSPIFADNVPDEDAEFVARLRAAGAIIIGKTNTPEFGLGSHSFNPVHGVTSNPYDPTRTAGGSSGGAAAALAARLLPIADGSDMMGSLRNPAAFCNVYGYRPTWGLIPSEAQGDMYLHQLATVGPMARSPADIAALLDVMSGPNPKVPYRVEPDPNLTDLSAPVAGRKIAWLGDWGGTYPCEDGIVDICKEALSVFEGLGCEIVPIDPPFDVQQLWTSWMTLRAWGTVNKQRPLYDNPETRAKLKPAMVWEIEQGLALSVADIHAASMIRSAWFRKLVELSETYDAFAAPTAQVWPFPKDWIHPETINGIEMDTYHRWMEVVIPVSLIGLPALAIPAGFGDAGLPMGFQLFGAPGADRDILTLGQAYHMEKDWTQVRP